MIPLGPRDGLAAVVGAAAAHGTNVAVARLGRARRVPVMAAALVAAALVYPAARRRRRPGAALARELAATVGYGALAAAAARRGGPVGSRVLAAAWASHALFDALHAHDDDSLIPDWYPALCAGYDLVVAADLARGPVGS
jgi:hypothetical protein